jgi:hypothetical protein
MTIAGWQLAIRCNSGTGALNQELKWNRRESSPVIRIGGELGDVWEEKGIGVSPLGRSSAAAVWTGKEMIVWGGFSLFLGYVGDGGRYDPEINS